MPVPASIDDLSTTASSNSPAGSETPTDGDNYIRTLSSFIALLRDKLNGTSNTGTVKNATFSGTMAGAASWAALQSFAAGISVSGSGGNVLSGTYTPTLTAGGNCAGTPSANAPWIYSRVGNVVSVFGSIATTGGFSLSNVVSVIYASVPIASAFTISQDAHGSGQFGNSTAYGQPYVDADFSNDRVEIVFVPATTSGAQMFFSFSYVVK